MSRDAVTPTVTQLVPIKVMVWAAVSEKGLIGPYFFHKNSKNIPVNRHSYQECVLWFVEELKRRRMLKKSYFMQDAAAPDTAISTKNLLRDIFQDRLIGKGFSLIWPPYSPDLAPADFWLWSKLKAMIFSKRQKPITSVMGLKLAIIHALRRLQSEKFDHVVPSVLRRLSSCVAKNGYRQ